MKPMSKQLALSSAFAVFAMVAFALSATPDASRGRDADWLAGGVEAGASIELPALPRLLDLY